MRHVQLTWDHLQATMNDWKKLLPLRRGFVEVYEFRLGKRFTLSIWHNNNSETLSKQ
jgi:hypothetical protein